jgi:hypothetical protein
MNNLKTLQVFLKDSPSTKNKNNKNLFTFINLNYQEIIQSGFYIEMILLNNTNYKKIPKGIKNTPALFNITTEEIIIGSYEIINYFITLCEGSPYDETKTNGTDMGNSSFDNKKIGDNDDIRNFLLNEALADDTIEDPIDLNKVKDKENKYKLKQEKQKSTNPKLKNNMIRTFRNTSNNNTNSIDNLPKEEKNKYDNEEVTSTRPISDYMSDDKDLEKFWQNMDEST